MSAEVLALTDDELLARETAAKDTSRLAAAEHHRLVEERERRSVSALLGPEAAFICFEPDENGYGSLLALTGVHRADGTWFLDPDSDDWDERREDIRDGVWSLNCHLVSVIEGDYDHGFEVKFHLSPRDEGQVECEGYCSHVSAGRLQ